MHVHRGVGHGAHLPPQIHQKYIHIQIDSHRTATDHWQKTSASQKGKKSPHNWVGQKKEKEKEIGMGPVPLGGSCERGKVSIPWEVPSLSGRTAGTEGDLWSLGKECSNQLVQGKVERDLHRWSVPTGTPQPETLFLWGGQGLSVEARALEVRPWAEDWGWLHGDSLRGLGCGVPQPREYRKEPGPIREGAQEGMQGEGWVHHRNFFLCACSQVAQHCCEPLLPSQTPEARVDCCHHQGSYEQVQVAAPTLPGACMTCCCCHDLEQTAAPAFLGACMGCTPAHLLQRG